MTEKNVVHETNYNIKRDKVKMWDRNENSIESVNVYDNGGSDNDVHDVNDGDENVDRSS